MSEQIECESCEGCGKICNDGSESPWKYWDNPSSTVAIAKGWIAPETCKKCNGTGKLENKMTPKPCCECVDGGIEAEVEYCGELQLMLVECQCNCHKE